MINPDLLEKPIALITFILMLALLAHSTRTLLKKVFKLRSLQIRQPLVHLSHNALGRLLSFTDNKMPFLRQSLPRKRYLAGRAPHLKAPYSRRPALEVYGTGRQAWTSKLRLDSISKEDLAGLFTKWQQLLELSHLPRA